MESSSQLIDEIAGKVLQPLKDEQVNEKLTRRACMHAYIKNAVFYLTDSPANNPRKRFGELHRGT